MSILRSIEHVLIAIPEGGEERARTFYVGLLGLPEVPKPAELAKRGGAWFEEGDIIKLHVGVEEEFHPARKAHVAFLCTDVRALAARGRALGFEVVDDDALEGYERIYIYDPFGNRFEFMEPKEK